MTSTDRPEILLAAAKLLAVTKFASLVGVGTSEIWTAVPAGTEPAAKVSTATEGSDTVPPDALIVPAPGVGTGVDVGGGTLGELDAPGSHPGSISATSNARDQDIARISPAPIFSAHAK